MESKDEIAQRLYNAPYGQLSVFAQAVIESRLAEQVPQVIQRENEAVLKRTLEERLELLSRRVVNVELENEELWIENSELKQQLATLQAELNQKYS